MSLFANLFAAAPDAPEAPSALFSAPKKSAKNAAPAAPAQQNDALDAAIAQLEHGGALRPPGQVAEPCVRCGLRTPLPRPYGDAQAD